MTGLVDGAIGRARMVLVILVCALIAGIVTYIALPKESDPDVAFPMISIFVSLDGVSPEDSERLLVWLGDIRNRREQLAYRGIWLLW